MTFGKPQKPLRGMSRVEMDDIYRIINLIPDAKENNERKKARQQRRRTMRKAENNEHRTPRRSNPTVARPVLSRVGGTNAAGTRVTNEGLFEQGLRRPAEVERAVYSAVGEGYGVFYPGHPAIRGGRTGRGDR